MSNNISTKEIIITSALDIFGHASYQEGSINQIREKGQISKGIVYHYFRDKDELYLECEHFSIQEFYHTLKIM